MLYAAHARSLLERSITEALANKNKLESVSSTVVKHSLNGTDADGYAGNGTAVFGDAIAIPYHDLNGAEILGDDGVPFVRYRVFDTRTPQEMEGHSPQRYLARAGAGARLYVPAGFAEKAPYADFIVLTEGEFKAIAGTANDIPTVSIPGVTIWAKEAGPLTEDSLVNEHIVNVIKSSGAKGVLVLADSDARTNEQVRSAMQKLAVALTRDCGIPCFYGSVKPPKDAKGKLDDKRKLGLDDWLNEEKPSLVMSYLKWVWQTRMEEATVLATNGYVALGFKGEMNYAWSVPRECVVTLSSNDITSPGKLLNLVGGTQWCELKYGMVNEKTNRVSIDYARMGGDLVSGCIAKGYFDCENTRGTGVWLANERLVVNSGEALWSPDGEPCTRFGGEYIFQKGHNLGIQSDLSTPAATTSDAEYLHAALNTWRWKSEADSTLFFGWAMLAFLAGALEWRPHASLTAPAGSGKSLMQTFLANVFGPLGLYTDGAGTTEAGLRQKVDINALALFIDEGEATSEHITKTLALLRSASSGSLAMKGTQDQKGRTFVLRSIGLVTCINPPVFNDADESRFVRLELLPQPDDIGDRDKHELISDVKYARALGQRLFVRMIRSWDRLHEVNKILRQKVTAAPRFKDTFVMPAAAAWVALNDGIITDEQAAEFVAMFGFNQHQKRIQEAKVDNDALDFMLDRITQVQVGERSVRVPIGDLISSAVHEFRNKASSRMGPYEKALGSYGMRVINEKEGLTLLIHAGNAEFKGLFANSDFKNADLTLLVKRHKLFIDRMMDTVNIGSKTVRPLGLLIKDLPLAANDSQFVPKLLTADDLG